MKRKPGHWTRCRWFLASWAMAACAPVLADISPSPLRLELVQPVDGGDRLPTRQLLLSPDGQRMARLSRQGLSLWQLQPPRLLAQVPSRDRPTSDTASKTGWRTEESITFDGTGRLHYLSHAAHLWLDTDLTEGIGDRDVKMLSPDGRYALRSSTVGDQPGQLPPLYSGARYDIYDLREQRSVCQLPSTAANPGAFGGHWFAAPLWTMGPSIPRPVVVCDMSRGLVTAISPPDEKKLVSRDIAIDPQGRFLRVTSSGHGFFGGRWVENRLFTLPLPAAAFAIGQGSAFDCRDIPCGDPAPLVLPQGDGPWTKDISPDGRWWVVRASPPDRTDFFLTDGTSARRKVVFSRNGRWAALQFEQKLFRVDLQAEPLEPAEVRLDTQAAFELEGIGDSGADWLLRDAAEPATGVSVSGLWRLGR